LRIGLAASAASSPPTATTAALWTGLEAVLAEIAIPP
jgi:hypothetical protein